MPRPQCVKEQLFPPSQDGGLANGRAKPREFRCERNAAEIPPPATSDFAAVDEGNCSPRFMRSTLNYVPSSRCRFDSLTH